MILPLTLEKTLSNARQVEIRFNCFLFNLGVSTDMKMVTKLLYFSAHTKHIVALQPVAT